MRHVAEHVFTKYSMELHVTGTSLTTTVLRLSNEYKNVKCVLFANFSVKDIIWWQEGHAQNGQIAMLKDWSG